MTDKTWGWFVGRCRSWLSTSAKTEDWLWYRYTSVADASWSFLSHSQATGTSQLNRLVTNRLFCKDLTSTKTSGMNWNIDCTPGTQQGWPSLMLLWQNWSNPRSQVQNLVESLKPEQWRLMAMFLDEFRCLHTSIVTTFTLSTVAHLPWEIFGNTCLYIIIYLFQISHRTNGFTCVQLCWMLPLYNFCIRSQFLRTCAASFAFRSSGQTNYLRLPLPTQPLPEPLLPCHSQLI